MKRFLIVPLIALIGLLYWKMAGESKGCITSPKIQGYGEVAGVVSANTRLPALNIPLNMKGKTVLLNLWATWCAPCKLEMPALNTLQTKMGDKDFEVIAVNIDTRNFERATEFYKAEKIDALTYYADPTADIFQILKKANLAIGMPTSLLINKEGCVVASLAGAAEWASQDALTLISTLKASH